MAYEYEVQPFYNCDGKRDGWQLLETDANTHYFIVDIYPTKAMATKIMKEMMASQTNQGE